MFSTLKKIQILIIFIIFFQCYNSLSTVLVVLTVLDAKILGIQYDLYNLKKLHADMHEIRFIITISFYR